MHRVDKVFLGDCGSPDHQILFQYFPDDDIETAFICISVHLKKLPFFKRVYHAIMYVFGKKCIYGDFEEVLLNYKEVLEMSNFINDFFVDTSKYYEIEQETEQ